MNVSLPLAWGVDASVTIPLSDVSTPLMFLSPHDAHIVQLSTYLHLASTGVLIWDFLSNLRNDCKLLSRYKLSVPNLLYFIIRLSLIAYAIGRAILLTTPVKNCGALALALDILLVICIGSAAAFFYIRMVAIYSKNRYIISFFGVTWLATIAMAVLFTQTFTAAPIPLTGYCKEGITGNFLVPILGFMLANDSLIYLAIAHRIYRIFSDYEFEAGLKRRIAILLFGASLPVGSKVVLLESQLSCLIIIVSKFCLVVALAIDQKRYYIFIICHLVLKVVLASGVYRELRGVSDYSPKPAVTDFRTANLTSAVFRDGVTRPENDQERKTRALDDASSIAGSLAHSSLHGSSANFASDRLTMYGGSETVNMDIFSETSTPRSYERSFADIRGDKEAQMGRRS